jgi:hypothetical protein
MRKSWIVDGTRQPKGWQGAYRGQNPGSAHAVAEAVVKKLMPNKSLREFL